MQYVNDFQLLERDETLRLVWDTNRNTGIVSFVQYFIPAIFSDLNLEGIMMFKR